MKNYKLLAVVLALLMVGQTGAVESSDQIKRGYFQRADQAIKEIGFDKNTVTLRRDKMSADQQEHLDEDLDAALIEYLKLQPAQQDAIKKIADLQEAEGGDDTLILKSAVKIVNRLKEHTKKMNELYEKNSIKLMENKKKQQDVFITPQQRSELEKQEKELLQDMAYYTKIILGAKSPAELNSKAVGLSSPSVVEETSQNQGQAQNEESKDNGDQHTFKGPQLKQNQGQAQNEESKDNGDQHAFKGPQLQPNQVQVKNDGSQDNGDQHTFKGPQLKQNQGQAQNDGSQDNGDQHTFKGPQLKQNQGQLKNEESKDSDDQDKVKPLFQLKEIDVEQNTAAADLDGTIEQIRTALKKDDNYRMTDKAKELMQALNRKKIEMKIEIENASFKDRFLKNSALNRIIDEMGDLVDNYKIPQPK